jgi:hypothetical protein
MSHLLTRILFSVPLRLQYERRKAFVRVFNFAYFNKIEGAYIEFGVASGMTLKLALSNANARNMNQMEFIGVDTFLGFPETDGPEIDFKTYSSIVGSRSFSKSTIRNMLKDSKAKKISLIKLNMETDNLNDLKEVVRATNIAIAHLDMDYYSPTRNALDVIRGSLSVGSILLFDNYFFFAANDSMGERRALSEFKLSNPNMVISDYFTYGWHGKAFIVSTLLS